MIKAYNPKIHASTFLTEVVGLTHTVIRLFEMCVEDQKQVYVKRKSRKRAQKSATADGGMAQENEDEEDKINARVYDELVFDFKKEVLEFCHPKVVNVYLLLVESYKTNGVMVNHFVTKMLHRIAVGCDLKGLFYRLSVLKTFNIVLSDGSIKKDKDYNELRGFLKFLVASYRTALEKNPFLGLEALFESTRRHAMLFDMDDDEIEEMDRAKEASRHSWTAQEDTRLQQLYETINASEEKHVLEAIMDELDGTRGEMMVVNRLRKLGLITAKKDLRDVDSSESDSEFQPSESEQRDDEAQQKINDHLTTVYNETPDGPDRIKTVAAKCEMSEKRTKYMLRLLGLMKAKRKKKQKPPKKQAPRKKVADAIELDTLLSTMTALENDIETRGVCLKWISTELKQAADIRAINTKRGEEIRDHELLMMDDDQDECAEKADCQAFIRAAGLLSPDEADGTWTIPKSVSQRQLYLFAEVITAVLDAPGNPLSEELRSRAEGFAPPRKKRVTKSGDKTKKRGRKKKNKDTSDDSDEDGFARDEEPEFLDVLPSSSSDDEDVFERMRRQRDEINRRNNPTTDTNTNAKARTDTTDTDRAEGGHEGEVRTQESEADAKLRKALTGVWQDHAEAVQWLKEEMSDIQAMQAGNLTSEEEHMDLFPLEDFKERALADLQFQAVLSILHCQPPRGATEYWHFDSRTDISNDIAALDRGIAAAERAANDPKAVPDSPAVAKATEGQSQNSTTKTTTEKPTKGKSRKRLVRRSQVSRDSGASDSDAKDSERTEESESAGKTNKEASQSVGSSSQPTRGRPKRRLQRRAPTAADTDSETETRDSTRKSTSSQSEDRRAQASSSSQSKDRKSRAGSSSSSSESETEDRRSDRRRNKKGGKKESTQTRKKATKPQPPQAPNSRPKRHRQTRTTVPPDSESGEDASEQSNTEEGDALGGSKPVEEMNRTGGKALGTIGEALRSAFADVWEGHTEAIQWLKDEMSDIQTMQQSNLDAPDDNIELFPLEDFQEKAVADKKFNKLLELLHCNAPTDQCEYWHFKNGTDISTDYQALTTLVEAAENGELIATQAKKTSPKRATTQKKGLNKQAQASAKSTKKTTTKLKRGKRSAAVSDLSGASDSENESLMATAPKRGRPSKIAKTGGHTRAGKQTRQEKKSLPHTQDSDAEPTGDTAPVSRPMRGKRKRGAVTSIKPKRTADEAESGSGEDSDDSDSAVKTLKRKKAKAETPSQSHAPSDSDDEPILKPTAQTLGGTREGSVDINKEGEDTKGTDSADETADAEVAAPARKKRVLIRRNRKARESSEDEGSDGAEGAKENVPVSDNHGGQDTQSRMAKRGGARLVIDDSDEDDDE